MANKEQDKNTIEMERYFKEVYGKPNLDLRNDLYERLGVEFRAFSEQAIRFGVTIVPHVFSADQIAMMQKDVAKWEQTKKWDRDNHMGFDGTSAENYLGTSVTMSEAVTNPAIFNLASAILGQHPKMNTVKTELYGPIEPYERRAFQWHHDGHSEIGLRAMILLTDLPDSGQAMLYCPSTNKRDWKTKSSRETRFNKQFVGQFENFVCSGKAGDVIIFNQHGVHRGQRNNTLRRDVILVNFQPGLARNYVIPTIHPDVAKNMSDYEKIIFGVVEHKESSEITEFVNANSDWIKKMTDLKRSYSLPVSMLKGVFELNGTNSSIDEKGIRNESVQSGMDPFVDSDKTLLLSEFKAELKEKQIVNFDQINFDEEIAKDMRGDLDLPIRLYHPNRDQIRDNATLQTRDRNGDVVKRIAVEELQQINLNEVVNAYLGGYESLADRMLLCTSELALLPKDQSVTLQTSSMLFLLEDLSEMAKRAYDIDLVKRTILYTYFMAQQLSSRYESGGLMSPQNYDQLRALTKEALFTYAKLVMLDR